MIKTESDIIKSFSQNNLGKFIIALAKIRAIKKDIKAKLFILTPPTGIASIVYVLVLLILFEQKQYRITMLYLSMWNRLNERDNGSYNGKWLASSVKDRLHNHVTLFLIIFLWLIITIDLVYYNTKKTLFANN